MSVLLRFDEDVSVFLRFDEDVSVLLRFDEDVSVLLHLMKMCLCCHIHYLLFPVEYNVD